MRRALLAWRDLVAQVRLWCAEVQLAEAERMLADAARELQQAEVRVRHLGAQYRVVRDEADYAAVLVCHHRSRVGVRRLAKFQPWRREQP